jgi:hypothetical protein
MLPLRYLDEGKAMTEQELINTINALIDKDPQAECSVLDPKYLARRAIDRCGEGVFEEAAVADLAHQILTIRCEPWMVLPGTKPRLREWGDGVARLIPKPTVLEILEAGRQSGEPLEVTLARANPTGDELEAYRSWVAESH